MVQIAFITHEDKLLGSSRSLLNLIDGLQNMNIVPLIVSESGTYLQKASESRMINYVSTLPVWWMTPKKITCKTRRLVIIKLSDSFFQLNHLARQSQFDVIYSNSSVVPVGNLVAKRNHLPHIWHIREFGNLDFSLRFIFPEWLCRKFILSSTAVICNSKAVREYHFGRKPRKNVHVIYNGVATRHQYDTYKEKASQTTSNHVYTFLIIGSLSARKGQDTAIRALAELKQRGYNARLLIAGSGREPSLTNLQTLANELGLSAEVEFLGYIPDPYEAYFKSDCLLMCSEYEAFGRVTAEAMSACLPVIGKNSGGTPEVLSDNETGFLYNTRDELVGYMEKLVRDRELGRRMGLAGWQRAKEMFNIEDYAANVYKVIQSVIKQ